MTVVEMQQIIDIEKTDSKKEITWLWWTIYNDRRKVFLNFQSDTDELIVVVYRYRNSLYLKDKEFDLKLTEHQSILLKTSLSLELL